MSGIQVQGGQALDNPTVDMSVAQVDQLEKQAKAQVAVAQESAAKVETATQEIRKMETSPSQPGASGPSSYGGGASGRLGGGNSAEASLYMDMGSEVLGLKTFSTAMDFLDTRRMDAAHSQYSTPMSGKTDGIVSHVRSMEQMISDTGRKPGHYASADVADKFVPRSRDDIIPRVEIARMSMTGQGSGALATWGIQQAQMSNVKMAKEMTLGLRNASEHTLQAVQAVRPKQEAAIGFAMQTAPSIGYGSGPRIRTSELLGQARKHSDDSGSWGGAA